MASDAPPPASLAVQCRVKVDTDSTLIVYTHNIQTQEPRAHLASSSSLRVRGSEYGSGARAGGWAEEAPASQVEGQSMVVEGKGGKMERGGKMYGLRVVKNDVEKKNEWIKPTTRPKSTAASQPTR